MSTDNAAGSGNPSDPTVDPVETGPAKNLDVPVTDVRDSQYAPSSETVSDASWAKRPGIEEAANQHADTFRGKA
jgi:hypothetical protein